MSVTIASKSLVASGWNTIAAAPAGSMLCSVSSVTYAVEMPNSRSVAGPLTSWRPVRMSRRPISVRERCAGVRRCTLEALCSRLEPLSAASRCSSGGWSAKMFISDFFARAGMM